MPSMDSMRVRHRFELVGIVQGVGFRPFVYRLAQRFRLAGYVRNHSRGVTIEVEGPPDSLEQFAQALQREQPPAAVIDAVDRRSVDVQHASDFVIVASDAESQQSTPASPDLATCDDCLREFFDRSD
ncbi:MAG TPA: carbamoyltransferase HypF, partial [Planctomycetaceae bacterium]|nr:carbamoyltransferase HypF [Planctomycetaceae bacterium]